MPLKATSAYCARLALSESQSSVNIPAHNADYTDHRNTPKLSMCDVARKSLVGEKDRLVATLEVLKASIKRPVGTSNVLMMESSELVTSHLESGENA